MYVCNCNGLSCRKVREAVVAGRGTVAAVFQAFESRPQCGKCVPEIRSMIEKHCEEGGTAPILLAAE